MQILSNITVHSSLAQEQFHRIIERLRLESTSGVYLVQAGAPRPVAQDHVQMAFELSRRMETPQPPWTTCASAQSPSLFYSLYSPSHFLLYTSEIYAILVHCNSLAHDLQGVDECWSTMLKSGIF